MIRMQKSELIKIKTPMPKKSDPKPIWMAKVTIVIVMNIELRFYVIATR